MDLFTTRLEPHAYRAGAGSLDARTLRDLRIAWEHHDHRATEGATTYPHGAAAAALREQARELAGRIIGA